MSPGSVTVIMAAIIASVLPQVVTISLSGSMVRPIKRDCLAARASLKFCAPQVMEYWWKSSWETSASRSRMASGGSKSGKPWDRFTAPYLREIRVIRRMTESVKPDVRSERLRMGLFYFLRIPNWYCSSRSFFRFQSFLERST